MSSCKVHLIRIEDRSEHVIKSMRVSQLGFLMMSIYDPDRKITCNYTVGKVWDFLPNGFKLDETKNIEPI